MAEPRELSHSPRNEDAPRVADVAVEKVPRWVSEDARITAGRTPDVPPPLDQPLQVLRLSMNQAEVTAGQTALHACGAAVVRDGKGREHKLVLLGPTWTWTIASRTERELSSKHVLPYWTIAVAKDSNREIAFLSRLVSVDTGEIAWSMYPDDVTLSVGSVTPPKGK